MLGATVEGLEQGFGQGEAVLTVEAAQMAKLGRQGAIDYHRGDG